MKRHFGFINLLLCLMALIILPPIFAQEKKGEHHDKHEHKFKVVEVEKFHDLLAPIWHEQYPAKEWAKIRAQGEELVRRKNAVMKAKLDLKAEAKAKAEELRKKFGESVDDLAKVAKSGTDEELQKSVAVMHEAFEDFFDAIK
jgi:hypothetical protein